MSDLLRDVHSIEVKELTLTTVVDDHGNVEKVKKYEPKDTKCNESPCYPIVPGQEGGGRDENTNRSVQEHNFSNDINYPFNISNTFIKL